MEDERVILLVGLECRPEAEDKFNQWYDEHIPLMLKFPGVKAATRYKIAKADGKHPNYLAIYQFESQQAYGEYANSPEREVALKHVSDSWGDKLPYERRWRVAYRPIKTWNK